MNRHYRKLVLPTPDELDRYQHEQDASDKRFIEFLSMLRRGTCEGTGQIALFLGVSRMTVYSWAALIRNNHPLKNPGRRRKYKDQASVPVSVRIPRSVAEVILGCEYNQVGPSQKTLIRQACERILVRELGFHSSTG